MRRALARPELELRGLHAHIGSQIFDTGGFEVAVRRLLGLHAQVVREHGVALPELGLGGGFGIAYTSEHDPLPPAALAGSLAEIVGQECRALGVAVPRVCVEPGRAIAGPSTFTLYRAGTIKDVAAGARHGPPLRRGGRRDERQHPHRRCTTPTTPARWPRASHWPSRC